MINCCVGHHRDLRSAEFRTLAPIWSTPLAKAGRVTEADYKWLHDIADGQAPEVQQAFLDAIDQIKNSSKAADLQAAIATGSVDKVLSVLGFDELVGDVIRARLLPPLEDTFIAAGRATPAATLPKGGRLTMRFDVSNPNAVRFIRDYDLGLIKQVTDDTRAGIRQVVTQAMEFGGHPREQARRICDLIGLTDNQAQAVQNFRGMLESGDKAALTRQLRDRRFDPTLRRALSDEGANLDADQIETMVGRYRDKMLNARATNIARTETINAAEAGKQTAWEQAANGGLLERTKLRQGWLVTPDDRLCTICAVIPLMNPDGVPLGGTFKTPVGPLLRPVAHPQCRCDLYLMAL